MRYLSTTKLHQEQPATLCGGGGGNGIIDFDSPKNVME